MIDLRNGDCLEVLKNMEDNSVDLILTDPPYHLTSITKRFGKKGSAPASTKNNDGSFSRLSKGFMGKEWDGLDENGVGIAFNVEVWKEAYRVLKPGGYCMAFSGTRTYHRMATAIEDAGFEIKDMIEWVYGSGFPKALDISKAIDKKLGAERTETYIREDFFKRSNKKPQRESQCINGEKGVYSKPSSDIAKQYEGYKTQLKPAKEPIIIARKKSDISEEIKEFKPFIYCAKASKKDRNGDIYENIVEGLNNHPTVKSTNLMQNLFKEVVSSENMVVLDMFAGSGSTGVAIEKYNIENRTNHKCILIEREKEYAEIIKKRCCLEEV